MNEKYKIIFVTEDKIEYCGNPIENIMHSTYLIEYIQRYFNEHQTLSKLTEKTGAESLAYALTYFEKMAIILNETKIGSDGRPKYGTFACLELPGEISPKLQKQLMSLKDNLKTFTQLFVEKSTVVDNYLTGEIIEIDNSLSIEEKLEQIFDKVNNHENIRR